MITTKWIDRDFISGYKQIANTNFDNKINELIIESQFMDLRPLLGQRLYDDINNNIANYTFLLEGGNYTYQGVEYTNQGLKVAAVYYFYARYAYYGSVTDTPFSLVNKINGDKTQPATTEMKKAMFNNNQNIAFNIWQSVELYLIRTENELFNTHCRSKRKNFRFSTIGKKNDNHNQYRRNYLRNRWY